MVRDVVKMLDVVMHALKRGAHNLIRGEGVQASSRAVHRDTEVNVGER